MLQYFSYNTGTECILLLQTTEHDIFYNLLTKCLPKTIFNMTLLIIENLSIRFIALMSLIICF